MKLHPIFIFSFPMNNRQAWGPFGNLRFWVGKCKIGKNVKFEKVYGKGLQVLEKIPKNEGIHKIIRTS